MTPDEHLAMAERLLKDASNTSRADAATRAYRAADAHARIAQAQVAMVTNELLAKIATSR